MLLLVGSEEGDVDVLEAVVPEELQLQTETRAYPLKAARRLHEQET